MLLWLLGLSSMLLVLNVVHLQVMVGRTAHPEDRVAAVRGDAREAGGAVVAEVEHELVRDVRLA